MADGGEWSFDPPASIRAAEAAWRARFDRQPTAFLHADLPALLDAVTATVATRFGVGADTLAFVENATAGVNAVLRSWRHFAPGDEILLLDQAYGAVRNACAFVARTHDVRLVDARLPLPRCTPQDAADAVERALTPRTALAILDHVTSPAGLVLPVREMVSACHARGVPVLVDGAHAPGRVPLDLAAIGADWYAGNLHKWYFAPAGTGFLHARRDRQEGLHPASISHGLDGGFRAEFDWTGTRDFSPWLAAPDAMALHDRLGGETLMARNATLVREGAALVARAAATFSPPACLPGAMALVALPEACGAAIADALAWGRRLIAQRIDVPVVCLGGRLFLRLSAHAWNTLADFERLAQVALASGLSRPTGPVS